MRLARAAKEAIVAEVAEVANRSSFAMALEYSGLTVAHMTELRKVARGSGVFLRVVRNTLAKRALASTHFACMTEGLAGQLILSFSRGEPGRAARVVRDFAKGNDRLQLRLIALNGVLLPPADLERLASLPSLDEARAMLLGVLQGPPRDLLRTVAESPSGLVRVLAAKRDRNAAAN